jgi:hypothetical protein
MCKIHQRLFGITLLLLLLTLASCQTPGGAILSAGDQTGNKLVVLETYDIQIGFASDATLTNFKSKCLGEDFVSTTKLPLMTVRLDGKEYQSNRLTKAGDKLIFQFPLPQARVAIKYRVRRQHIVFEVADAWPDVIEELRMVFPVRRLQKVGVGFNGTYDSQFGICFFGATANVRNLPFEAVGLKVAVYKKHGIKNARFVLVAAPFDQFKTAIMDAERDNGIPCPILQGKWARDSDAVGRSYLFITDATEVNIDKLIEYAKVGNFGAILLAKESVFANHGHFDISRKNFPGGIGSLKKAVAKIHQAGLDAGIHVFGPSISPNDSFITPKPDSRLAKIIYPPLDHAIDQKTDILTWNDLPPDLRSIQETKAFPGIYFQIGEELIQCSAVDKGRPVRYLKCRRGALGTKATSHIEGDKVRRLLVLWDYFLVDPDSSLADELTERFTNVVNECDLDFVYLDASDGMGNDFFDAWYYLSKLHLGFYSKFKKDILYQTSNGVEANLVWHITPRAASADGQGDIRGYLNQRWPIILKMEDEFTARDIGWYYWFGNSDVSQIEYVCAKALGINASLSIETSVDSLERIPQSRQLFEIIGRYERCRQINCLPEMLKLKLLEQNKDYKLLKDTDGYWHVYRVAYEKARQVNMLDGQQNAWELYNELPQTCLLGFEIAAGSFGLKTGISGKSGPTLDDNGETVEFPVQLNPGQVLTNEGIGETLYWEGAMKQAKTLRILSGDVLLRPGDNRIIFSWTRPEEFPGGIQVILYRLWPISSY